MVEKRLILCEVLNENFVVYAVFETSVFSQFSVAKQLIV
jgi:hypothetical protein